MAGKVLDRVLPFSIRIVSGCSQDPRPTLTGTLVVAVDILHAHHHRMCDLASA